MKGSAYARLVAARKACRACPALTNPSIAAEGDFDSDRIGPFTRWQGNPDSELVVVGQDFAGLDKFGANGGWPGAKNRTNLALVELLGAAGIEISPPRRGDPEDRLFFTNAVLCLKPGGMQGGIPSECFRACGERFLRPTIELVAPKAVVTLGRRALDAVLHPFSMRRDARFRDLLKDETTFDLPGGIRVFPMYHPSPTVLNTTRSLQVQKSDWARVGSWLRSVE